MPSIGIRLANVGDAALTEVVSGGAAVWDAICGDAVCEGALRCVGALWGTLGVSKRCNPPAGGGVLWAVGCVWDCGAPETLDCGVPGC